MWAGDEELSGGESHEDVPATDSDADDAPGGSEKKTKSDDKTSPTSSKKESRKKLIKSSSKLFLFCLFLYFFHLFIFCLLLIYKLAKVYSTDNNLDFSNFGFYDFIFVVSSVYFYQRGSLIFTYTKFMKFAVKKIVF